MRRVLFFLALGIASVGCTSKKKKSTAGEPADPGIQSRIEASDPTVNTATNSGTDTLPAVENSAPQPEGWTLIVYGHADHNLAQSLLTDLEEMEKVGSSEKFNIVVQADLDSKRLLEGGIPESETSGVRRLLISKHDDEGIGSEPVETLDELNMDDPKYLQDFIEWSVKQYPAKRYGLIMWDHGGQWAGFGGDTQDGTLEYGTPMKTKPMAEAIRSAMETSQIEKFEFVAFDTCLMGGAEVLRDFTDITRYYIANPEIDFGDGWDYTATFNWLKDNPDADTKDIVEQELRDWEAHHFREGNDTDKALAAHVAYDLEQYAAFQTAFLAFADKARSVYDSEESTLAGIRYGLTPYSVASREERGNPTEYVDLGEFASKIMEIAVDADLKSAAQDVITSLDAMVIGKVLGSDKQSVHGLSVWYPITGANAETVVDYQGLSLTADSETGWDKYLLKVSEYAPADATGPTITLTTQDELTISQGSTADFEFTVTGADYSSVMATVINNQLTNDPNKYFLIAETSNVTPVDGGFTFSWDTKIPSIGADEIPLGAFLMEPGSDYLVSYANYVPPGSDDGQLVILLIDQSTAKVIEVLDGSQTDDLAPRGIDVAAGGKLIPIYLGFDINDPDPNATLFEPADGFVTIPSGGLGDVPVSFPVAVTGSDFSLQVTAQDAYSNDGNTVELTVHIN